MSATSIEISSELGKLNEAAPSGYALGFHVQYTSTKFLFQTYEKKWLDYYSQHGLVMADPIVAWCFENTGYTRWSDLTDDAGVLVKAAEYGLNYGVVYATDAGGSRSMAGFARDDREFTDDEIAALIAKVDLLHAATADQAELSLETIAQLRNMSIMVTHPGL
ncbi:autoinducer binding domain-containing protein [Yoonia sediminilitoris]|uniref:LuxR family transcriptional regulator n=1 Tax=Yoonia sediminilitoris TaxID=1286148 RepID=A0A2T6KDT8_9RHOB|nr:autoinducer binding domain-containing protein [Yoonia sediminilitoris]PUB13173.1 LuxR family transcriptional regulator [Yoonia sediminilitoris]RCW94508.1 LuxR family transcriptional regulator [Yoonia sediminilitoris]